MKINILDSYIFNKIAAGEVVDKPASVVKELVENSIDAGAKNITVEIENGGIDMIKVTDDGSGMDKEDLKRVFLPHATSKISSVDDLAKIGTLGFRGEALASISAVADVQITSKTADGEGGQISCIDSSIGEVVDSGSGYGTTILVTDIFKNIPARRKFLRKPKAEENDITSYVEKLILANPFIAIKYIVNGKEMYSSTGQNLREAIYVIYGRQILDNLVEVSASYGNMKLFGYTSKPTFSKSNRNYQTLICNGRYILNQQISVAISNAYGQYMMKGQFPFYVLSIELPLDEVDVNVHPNKLEVRFANKTGLYSLFYNAVSDVLLTKRTQVSVNEFLPSDLKEETLAINTFTNDFIKNQSESDIQQILINKNIDTYKAKKESDIIELFDKKYQKINENNDTDEEAEQVGNDLQNTDDVLEKKFADMLKKSYDVDVSTSVLGMNSYKDENMGEKTKEVKEKKYSSFKDSVDENFIDIFSKKDKEISLSEQTLDTVSEPDVKIIGTCFDTYILVEKGDLFIIDQHAGHERLLYDELTKAINNRQVVTQSMLVPYVFGVDSTEVDFLETNIPILESLGFEISRIGGKEFSITGVPLILNGIDLKGFIDGLLKETSDIVKLKSSDLVADKLKTMSCRKAIKAGYKMTKSDIELLLKLTDERQTALMCPHGRPSVIRLTRSDFEKWFKRAV